MKLKIFVNITLLCALISKTKTHKLFFGPSVAKCKKYLHIEIISYTLCAIMIIPYRYQLNLSINISLSFHHLYTTVYDMLGTSYLLILYK